MFYKSSLLRRKQIISYSSAFGIVIMILAVIFHIYMMSIGQKISKMNCTEMARQEIKVVENYLDELENLSLRLTTDARLIQAFAKAREFDESKNYFDVNVLEGIDTTSVLTSINGPKAIAVRIVAYNNKGDYVKTGNSVTEECVKKVLEDAANKDYVDNMKKALDYKIILSNIDKWTNKESNYIVIQSPIMNPYSSEAYGIVEVQKDIEKLSQLLRVEDKLGMGIILIAADNSEFIISENKSYNGEYANEVIEKSDKYHWSIKITQDKESSIKPYIPLIVWVYICGIILTIVMSTIIAIISKRLCKPLIQLKDMVNDMTLQNIPNTKLKHQVNDEVKELNVAFSKMTDRISKSIELERKANLLALQAQMNPHFIYNVLAVISSAALEERNDNVINMCGALSNMLRYIASYEKMIVNFQSELDNTKQYLELMKFRYEEYFEYQIEIEQKVLDIHVPKLILQPLVENCFSHAFNNQEPVYKIYIKGNIIQDMWYIEIKDNGKGITQEEKVKISSKIQSGIENIGDKIDEMKIGGLGLVSTIVRLKLSFPDGIFYDIQDNEWGGTTILIKGYQ